MKTYDAVVTERREDLALSERLLARDEDALREVIDAYGDAVHGMARRVLAEPNLAEEVAQDTFVALWRRPGAYDPARGSLQSFIMGIARNKAVDLVRKEESLRRTAASLRREVEAMVPLEPGSSGRVEERDIVKSALQALTGLQREALVLAYFGGRTYREVATELDIPEGTAKTRLRDGLKKLREVLEASGMAI